MYQPWNSLPGGSFEESANDTFKERFDRHSKDRNLLFNVDIE